MSEEKIEFGVNINHGEKFFKIESNYTFDGREHISKEAKTVNDEEVFFLTVGDGEEVKEYFSIRIEDAEEIVRELTKALDFLKE
jgi:hypothetical protein